MDDMTKMAMEALVRELMKKNELAEDRIKELEEELKKKDELHVEELKKKDELHVEELKKKDEELLARSMGNTAASGVTVSERSFQSEFFLQPNLKEEEKRSSIEKMRMYSVCPERGEREIKRVIENPTFAVLYREEGHIRTPSPSGKGDKPKCKLFPDIVRNGGGCVGGGYFRWEEGNRVYYMAGRRYSGELKMYHVEKAHLIITKDENNHKIVKDNETIKNIGKAIWDAIGFS